MRTSRSWRGFKEIHQMEDCGRCGATPVLWSTDEKACRTVPTAFVVSCDSCGIKIRDYSQGAVVNQWNRQAVREPVSMG